MKEHTAILSKLCACRETTKWAEEQENFEECWNNFEQSDWMIWMIRKLNFVDINFYKKYACFCARQNWHLLTDQRSKDGIIAAEQYIAGKISIDEMKVAGKNAADAYASVAAYAANAADYIAAADAAIAANAADYIAAYAANAANAADYADYAAIAAAYAANAAAYAAAYASSAAAVARNQIKINQCNWIRSQISLAEIMEGIEDYFDEMS